MSEFPRELTPEERGILDFILEQDFEGCDGIRAMLRETVAVGTCSCGCGSIDLTVNPEAAPERWASPVPAEARATVEGLPFKALFFVTLDPGWGGPGGYLEFIWYGLDDESTHPPLPGKKELTPA